MKYLKFILLFIIVTSLPSCLEMGLEELPTFSDAEIINVKFEHRWSIKEGESDKLRVQTMNTNYTVDKNSNKVVCVVTVPNASGSFTESIRNSVSINNLIGFTTISTAATITPLDNAPKLGTPGDWSKPNRYLVTAADGTKKEWTIEVSEFIK